MGEEFFVHLEADIRWRRAERRRRRLSASIKEILLFAVLSQAPLCKGSWQPSG